EPDAVAWLPLARAGRRGAGPARAIVSFALGAGLGAGPGGRGVRPLVAAADGSAADERNRRSDVAAEPAVLVFEAGRAVGLGADEARGVCLPRLVARRARTGREREQGERKHGPRDPSGARAARGRRCRRKGAE